MKRKDIASTKIKVHIDLRKVKGSSPIEDWEQDRHDFEYWLSQHEHEFMEHIQERNHA